MSQNIIEILQRFPKERASLPPEYKVIYEAESLLSREGEAGRLHRAVRALESWGHRRLSENKGFGPLLELGAGTLNHVPFEGDDYPYDVVEPNAFYYRESEYTDRIRTVYADIGEISIATTSYKRIISKGVLEHIDNLPEVIARAALLLDDDGCFQHAIPSEGGLAWGAAWRCTTGLAFKLRTGLDYATLMRFEHINSAREILALVDYFFGQVKRRYFPLPGVQLSVYTYIEASAPRLDRCKDFLANQCAARAV